MPVCSPDSTSSLRSPSHSPPLCLLLCLLLSFPAHVDTSVHFKGDLCCKSVPASRRSHLASCGIPVPAACRTQLNSSSRNWHLAHNTTRQPGPCSASLAETGNLLSILSSTGPCVSTVFDQRPVSEWGSRSASQSRSGNYLFLHIPFSTPPRKGGLASS